jgi:orotidine-5'-phosphate decarboxylase
MIIPRDRSVIPACDVPFETFRDIVKETAAVEKVGAYKVGVAFLDIGLKKVVDTAREFTNKPIIYDHQKAGTDIHEATPDAFMDSMKRAGVNAVILFPQAGPITQYEWIKAAQARDLGVIVGGEMTHPRYLEGDMSEGKKNYTEIFKELGMRPLTGYLRKFAPEDMYELAARMGITDFVVPGNKPERISHFKEIIQKAGVENPVFYSPGLVAQGGEITEGAEAAGENFHAIVGRGIYKAEDKKAAALEHTSKI